MQIVTIINKLTKSVKDKSFTHLLVYFIARLNFFAGTNELALFFYMFLFTMFPVLTLANMKLGIIYFGEFYVRPCHKLNPDPKAECA